MGSNERSQRCAPTRYRGAFRFRFGGFAGGLHGGEIGLVADENAMDAFGIQRDKRQIFCVLRPGFGAAEEGVFGIGSAFGEDFVFEFPRPGHAILIENNCFGKLTFLGSDGRESGELVIVTLELGVLIGIDGVLPAAEAV